ncbi:MAG: PKD domain-containing protein, partial [Sphingobacteriia bacterium]
MSYGILLPRGGADIEKCAIGGYPNTTPTSVPYPMPANFVVYQDDAQTQPFTRRTLWYTFVVDGPGRVTVRVRNRTSGKTLQAPFSVYRSDADGTIDFATLRASGGIDSTVAQGLRFIDNSRTAPNWCPEDRNSVTFERNPCTETGRVRYYVIVDNNVFNYVNGQVDVSVQHEGFDNLPLVHDFCGGDANPNLNAANMGVLPSGVTVGNWASFSCATRSATDPNGCGNRTLWYTFESTFSGRLRINYEINPGNQVYADADNIQVYKAPDCASLDASDRVTTSTLFANSQPWSEGCLSPGRYYVLLTGCGYTIEQVRPRVWLIPQRGDLCTSTDPESEAVNIQLTHVPGLLTSASGSVNIDCHTIGEGFGEDGSNMGCLFGPTNYKSAWFKVAVAATEKVDLRFRLEENTNALPSNIRYRVLYGTCTALSAGPCNSDALTEFTLNCMQTGDYYVQVVVPAAAVGTVNLFAVTAPTTDQDCNPLNPLLPIVNFTIAGGCVNEPVQFSNFSTQGSDIEYEWEFGDPAASTSSDFEPSFTYTAEGTYTIRLTVRNTAFMPNLVATLSIPYDIDLKPTGSISVTSPATGGVENGCEQVIADTPYNFSSNSTNALAWYWDFASGGTSTDENPANIIFVNDGENLVSLTLINGNCTETLDSCFLAGLEPVFQGGPYDGVTSDVLNPCVEPLFYQGGPYDGATVDVFNPCVEPLFYQGGPYDGATADVLNPCVEPLFYQGGPYDGAASWNYAIALANESSPQQSLCAGTPVTLDITVAPAAGATSVSYWWSTGATTPTITVTPATTTQYLGRINFTHPGGCAEQVENTFTVVVLSGPVAAAGADRTFCESPTPTPTTLGSPAMAGYTYSWAPATGLSAANVAQPIATVTTTTTTTYTLTVTDPSLPGACATSTDQVVVSILPLPVVTPGSDQLVCPGGSATITATVSAGAGYEWFTLNPTTLAVTTTLGTASSYTVGTGVYGVRATNAACQSSIQPIRVNEEDITSLDYRSRDNGNWNALTTWEVKNPTTGVWVPAENLVFACGTIPYPTAQSDSVLV